MMKSLPRFVAILSLCTVCAASLVRAQEVDERSLSTEQDRAYRISGLQFLEQSAMRGELDGECFGVLLALNRGKGLGDLLDQLRHIAMFTLHLRHVLGHVIHGTGAHFPFSLGLLRGKIHGEAGGHGEKDSSVHAYCKSRLPATTLSWGPGYWAALNVTVTTLAMLSPWRITICLVPL